MSTAVYLASYLMLCACIFLYSLTWLKAQFGRLRLSRRGMYASDGIVRNCIKVCRQPL